VGHASDRIGGGDWEAFWRPDYRRMHAGLDVLLRINPGGSEEVQINLSGGSKTQHHIGRNVLAVGLDEGNFRLEPGSSRCR
jgi:hypothetical protein